MHLLLATHAFDLNLTLHGRRFGYVGFSVDESEGQASTDVLAALPLLVLLESFLDVVTPTGVVGQVAAPEDVDPSFSRSHT